MAKKLKLDKLHQTHGKIENPVTLDQIWGDSGKSKYGTLDPEKYSEYLTNLNKTDLQAHAVKIGLMPIDDRTSLCLRLKREFLKYSSQYTVKKNIQTNKPLSKAAKDTLSEGR